MSEGFLGRRIEVDIQDKTHGYKAAVEHKLPPPDNGSDYEFEWKCKQPEIPEVSPEEKISTLFRIKEIFQSKIIYCKQQLEILKENTITLGLNISEKNLSPATQTELRRVIKAGNGIMTSLSSFEVKAEQYLNDFKNQNLEKYGPAIEEIVEILLQKATSRIYEVQQENTSAIAPPTEDEEIYTGDIDVQSQESNNKVELYQRIRSIETDFRLATEVAELAYSENEKLRKHAREVGESYGIKDIREFVIGKIQEVDKILDSGEKSITPSSFYKATEQLYEIPDPEIQKATLALLDKHQGHFLTPYNDPYKINLANALLRFGDEDQRQKGVDKVKALLDEALTINEMELPQEEPPWYENDDIRAVLIQLLRYGNANQAEEAKQFLLTAFDSRENIGNTDEVLSYMCAIATDDTFPKSSFIGREILCSRLERYGIDTKKITLNWALSGANAEESLYRNAKAIIELEEAEPGIATYLTKQCGISDFDRYPSGLLLEQYRTRDDKDTPYGVIIFPRADWNGAFYEGKNAFAELQQQLGENFRVRIVECDTKTDIARQLIKLNKEYGQISFGILGGHGSPTSIQFGGNDPQHILRMRDLRGEGAQRLHEFFIPNAEISLLSCSTGADRGIGKRLSDITGTRVSAPNTPANIATYNATIEGNTVKFNVKYTDGANTSTFGGQAA